MARSLEEIYASLVDEKNSMSTINALQPSVDSYQTLLNDLTTPSRVSSWRLIFGVVATAILKLEQLWDIAKAILISLEAKIYVGTLLWYRDQCLKFQYGDTLVFINGQYQYVPVDETKKIVKRAACVENGGNVIIKVAKLVGAVVTPLDIPELTAFSAYIGQIKFAGTVTQIISTTADLLKLQYKVYYNPLVLAADGSLLSDPSVFPAEDAINNFITNLPFNGELKLSAIDDAIQIAPGISDVSRQLAEAKYGVLPYSTINDFYYPNAGYLNIDPSFPLNVQITYLPAA